MLDLTKIKLPNTIEVEGSFFNIKTDFRDWLLFGELINDHEAKILEILYLFKDNVPENIEAAIPALINFYEPKSELPRPTGKNSGEVILDYKLDADLIYSAFLEVYNIDLLTEFIHWHKFLALLNGLHNTKLNEVMSYRSYTDDGKDQSDYAKQMRTLKRAWRLPASMQLSEGTKKFNELLKKRK